MYEVCHSILFQSMGVTIHQSMSPADWHFNKFCVLISLCKVLQKFSYSIHIAVQSVQRMKICLCINRIWFTLTQFIFSVLGKFSVLYVGWDSSVSIVTRYGLDGLGIVSRCGARFSISVQSGTEAYPAFYTMGTGSFPGVKQPGRGIDHPPPSSAEVKERVELYLYSRRLRWSSGLRAGL
jgi:hypothetical protein